MHYDVTFYETDPLNALYNVIDDTPGPKLFFEGLAFRMDAEKLKEVEKRLDKLLEDTGPESYVDQLDGWSFIVTRKGKTVTVNTGPVLDKWLAYSLSLRDSVISPIKDLRKKGSKEPGRILDGICFQFKQRQISLIEILRKMNPFERWET